MSYRTESQAVFSVTPMHKLLRENHPYRKIVRDMDLPVIALEFRKYFKKQGSDSFGPDKGVRMLLLQFMEDLSDRQMEAALQENNAMKFFCGFELLDETPDHSYFGKTRARFGTGGMQELFNYVNKKLERKGLIGKVFSFVDSTAIITKLQTFEERDRAIEQQLENFNNKTADIVETKTDNQARFGCKGKDKFWFGYKRHVCQDVKAGVITKVAVTPANKSDAQGLALVCPSQGMILADKAYCTKKAQITIKINNCHSGAILKNNMKDKNFDKDRWLQKLRMPFEGVFAHLPKRARYRGLVKIQGQAFMQAIAWNLKCYLRFTPDIPA